MNLISFKKIFLSALIIFLYTILIQTDVYGECGDTTVVRLKSGAKIRGEIISGNKESFIIYNEELGNREVQWDEINFISSSEVYDSLAENKSILVLPPQEIPQKSIWDILSAEFLFGKGFNYDRFVGFGARVNVSVNDWITLGGIAVIHLGSKAYYKDDGYGSMFYWGPEVGFRFKTDYIIIEPSVSIGEGTLSSANDLYNPNPVNKNEAATVSKFYVSPGVGLKSNLGAINIGLQFRYVIIDKRNMAGLYLTFGN
ncbi:MAG: hypothetical protein IPM56_17875 [Ignavibacteriales bacterium]|nr:MAG: hypothetical protein IPM56_17875 [Ignavibacteriales bacterium]